MAQYIFVEEKTNKIVDKKRFYNEHPADKALGYAESLSKKTKTKVETYTKVVEN